MHLYFILQGKVCDCDVSAIFVDIGTHEVILGDSIIQITEPLLNAM